VLQVTPIQQIFNILVCITTQQMVSALSVEVPLPANTTAASAIHRAKCIAGMWRVDVAFASSVEETVPRNSIAKPATSGTFRSDMHRALCCVNMEHTM